MTRTYVRNIWRGHLSFSGPRRLIVFLINGAQWRPSSNMQLNQPFFCHFWHFSENMQKFAEKKARLRKWVACLSPVTACFGLVMCFSTATSFQLKQPFFWNWQKRGSSAFSMKRVHISFKSGGIPVKTDLLDLNLVAHQLQLQQSWASCPGHIYLSVQSFISLRLGVPILPEDVQIMPLVLGHIKNVGFHQLIFHC